MTVQRLVEVVAVSQGATVGGREQVAGADSARRGRAGGVDVVHEETDERRQADCALARRRRRSALGGVGWA